jgi:predicted 2-oxoglutarate/Fe(II)-dependent dioxygenase YbiX/peroxiredoxin
MSESATSAGQIQLGDPVPWFGARTVAGATVDLHVNGGRWIVLAFLNSLAEPRANHELAELLGETQLFTEERLVVYGVLTEPPSEEAGAILASISGPALGFIVDYDGAITRAYGALGSPRSIVLDPMLRAVANIPWDEGMTHAEVLRGFLRGLPDVDASCGVPMSAPVLIVPRIFDFDFCDLLVRMHEELGGTDSGFLLDQDGKTATVINHHLKQRQDLVITDPEVRAVIRDRIVRRLLPPIERYFQYQATRMDRYMVACYDSALGGHFYRHRDNMNAGAQHRRFAVSINLNTGYDGCDLIFPEFGSREYRAPCGGAVVFSCGALHEVTPVTKGRRFAFVPFLYGEADAALREANNANLQSGEAHYVGGHDMLFAK